MARRAIAGLLAIFLMIAATASVIHSLHRSFLPGADVNHHLCLFCSLAKGQVTAAEVALVPGIVLFACIFGLRPPASLPVADFNYRLSPSRAPPRA
jgi:hypothetical protein